MLESIRKVKQWAHDKNLIEGSDSITQYLKLVSELGELADDVNKKQDVRDSIGDCLVVLIIIAEQQYCSHSLETPLLFNTGEEQQKEAAVMASLDIAYLGYRLCCRVNVASDIKDVLNRLNTVAVLYGVTLSECLEHAYNEIKDRRGVMLDGVFIKEDDGAYAAAVEILGKD